jgi:hypothetical protein
MYVHVVTALLRSAHSMANGEKHALTLGLPFKSIVTVSYLLPVGIQNGKFVRNFEKNEGIQGISFSGVAISPNLM